MSIYLINKLFVFDEKNKELKTLNNGMNIKLTSMRARCLSFIIEHAKDEVIDKSAISYALWGPRSTFTSDASLTQILYLIRRDLKTLGLDEFLITVPKAGIRVNSSITINIIQEKKTKKPFSYPPILFSLIVLVISIAIVLYLIIVRQTH